jgi:RHS repeat-associated protein
MTSNSVNTYWQWEITQLIKDWYNGVQPNYGFMLKQQNETTSPYRSFNTVNSGNNTPRITINYTVDPIGLEDFWSTTEEGINPANGNLVLQETDKSVPGRGFDVSITRTFNSRKTWHSGMFGYGWWSNVEARLVDSGDGPITLIDGDNTRHIFGQKVGGGYTTPGGIYLDLVKNGDGTYTITEKDGTKVHFNTSGRIASIVDTNGNTTTFTYNGSGQLIEIEDASGRKTTIQYGANGYVSSITDPANRTTTYEYDGQGNLIKVIDPANFETTYGYDADHNITSITDAKNITTTIQYTDDQVTSISRPITINGTVETSTTTYSYDTQNEITTVVDGEGNRVDYKYSPNGNIEEIIENPLDAQNKAVTSFYYDNHNNLTKVVDANTNQSSGTQAYIYSYDENGNITSVQLPENQTESYTYDDKNNLIQEQDFNNNLQHYDYDDKNNLTESIDSYQQSTATRYDQYGKVLYTTHPMSVADNLVKNSNFEIDEDNNSWPDGWNTIQQSGTTATINWSTVSKYGNRSVSISNPTGWANVFSEMAPYQANEEYVVSSFVKTENTTGLAQIKVEYFDDSNNWLGFSMSYGIKGTHDWARLQLVIDNENVPSGTKKIRVAVGMDASLGTAYFDGVQIEKGTVLGAYNLVENSSFERSNNGQIPDDWETSGNLSANDQLDSSEYYVGSQSFKITGESGKNKFIKQTIPISGDENSRFTLSGYSKQVGANPNGGHYALQVAIHYTDGSTDWSNANDFDKTKEGWQHVAAEIKPDRAFDSIDVYYYFFDQSGTAWFDAMRLEEGASHTFYTYDTNSNYVTQIKDPLGHTVSYSYDAAGNQTSVTDGKRKTTSFEYNAKNQLTKVTDPNLNETTYGYDGVGNRTSVTNAKNHTTNYTYNEFNQVSSFTNPLNQTTSFEYDKNGNLTKVTYENGDTVSYSYNALNRLVSIAHNGVTKWTFTYDANGNVTSVTDENNQTVTYSYDKNNRLTQVDKGTSSSLTLGYDDNSNITSREITDGSTTTTFGYSYNPLNQLVALSRNSANLAKLTYDERGNISAILKANGTYTAYEYNDANLLKSIKNFDKTGSVLNYFIYSYDANGNITSVETESGTITYQYDALNQLIEETLLDGTTITYEYDSVGNRTKKIVTDGTGSTTTTYTYDAANQLTAVDGQVYTYDVNGNLIDNGEYTFLYNDDNRLVEVKDATNTTIATYTYDHQGRRISKTTSSGTTYYHYDGDSIRLLYETDENNNIIAEYTWDENGQPLTMTRNGVTYHYLVNGHGDVTALTDANGNIVAEYDYDAWGNVLSQTGSMASQNPIRYTGYYFDEETDLYYLMARYYDANIGRFLTRDSFHGFEDDPQSLNLYSYTKNNPVIYVDHDGHNPLLIAAAVQIIRFVAKKSVEKLQ